MPIKRNKEESEDEYVASSAPPSDHEDEASVASSEDIKPPAKKSKKSGGSGGPKEKKASLPKDPWPAEAKLRLFDFLIQSAAGGKINGGGSISMEQWKEVASEIGKTPQACKDQMRRGIVPKVRKAIADGVI